MIPTHGTYDRFIFQVLSSIKADKGQANDGLSSALLLVHLDSAKNLPVNTKIHIYTHAFSFLPVFLISVKPRSTFALLSGITSILVWAFLHLLFLSVVLLWFPDALGEEHFWGTGWQWVSERVPLCWAGVLWEHFCPLQDNVCESLCRRLSWILVSITVFRDQIFICTLKDPVVL